MSAVTTWHPSMGLPMPLEAEVPVPVPRPGRRFATLLVTLLGTVVLLAAGAWVTTSQIFAMRSLHVTGNLHLASDEVATIAGLTDRTNVLWVSSSTIVRRLEANPWVLSARVERTLPGGITVRITERVPVAILAGSHLIVAADGVVLGPATGPVRLPTIQGTVQGGSPPRVKGAPAGLGVAAAIPWPAREDVKLIAIAPDGQITLTLAGGIDVLYGDATQIAAKGRALQAVLDWADRNHVRPRTIDLHAPDAPAFTGQSGAPTSAR
jgi:cell division protein FtsQ